MSLDHPPARRQPSISGGFEEPEDGFADDDLVTSGYPDDALEYGGAGDRSYLERDNFENELGSPADNPFAEDFTDISKHEIVDVVGDDRAGRPIIVVYAYRLPSNKAFDHQKFLRYLQHTLDKFVDQDYTIVYNHYGLRSHNKPPMKWLVQTYRILDRRYKKNLKALYLVHPTKFIRLCWGLFRPIISVKFERKLHYVNYLHELDEFVRSDQLGLPQPVKDHDASLLAALKAKPGRPANNGSHPTAPLPTQQFGVSISFILNHHPDCNVPPIVTELIDFLRKHALKTEGIFRRSTVVSQVRAIQQRINKGEKIDFASLGNVHLPAVLLKTFLRELTEPVIPFSLYNDVLRITDYAADERNVAVRDLVGRLPNENYILLKTIASFLTEVMSHSDANLMNANNLAVVFGPNLAWPGDQQVSLAHLSHLNNFCYRLLTAYNVIFE
uniref:Rho GTPase activating protein 1 n=1 Tax=Plectus sambesii TaxID=2011161 RepID=A0A914WVH4_9BILA